MKAINIQVQPHLAPGVDIEAVRALMDRIATANPLVETLQYDDGHEGEYYLNITFWTPDLEALWKTIRERVYGDETIGTLIGASSIAVCEGAHGWDDYLLLHHFDSEERCDAL